MYYSSVIQWIRFKPRSLHLTEHLRGLHVKAPTKATGNERVVRILSGAMPSVVMVSATPGCPCEASAFTMRSRSARIGANEPAVAADR
jgi:hypothetical protein